MTNVKGFIDADGHVVESDSELLEFLPNPFKSVKISCRFRSFPPSMAFIARRAGLRTVKAVISPRAV